MPIKLQIKSSMSKLLPNTICSSSTMNGTAMATTKMFFLLTLSVTNGRKNPNGKNIAMFPMSIVFTQLPIVSSSDNAFMNDGVYNQDFLNAQPAVQETNYLRHVRFEKPVVVKMDGKKKLGVVLMPEA